MKRRVPEAASESQEKNLTSADNIVVQGTGFGRYTEQKLQT